MFYYEFVLKFNMFNITKLLTYDQIVIQCHDNPDPDTIASAFALYKYLMIQEKDVQIIYSGTSEIKKTNLLLMIDKLKIPIRFIKNDDSIPVFKDSKKNILVTVDCQYGSGNVKKIDADIKKLSDTLAEKEAEKPLIHIEPSFGLTQANINGTYPAPPAAGGERRFCQSQKADAFLTGEVREFHGRYYINLRLFTLYTNSYIYEDDIIFSMEDTDGAVEEIAARLTAVLSGNEPALVAVTADPPESQVLINRNYAGRGTVEARELPPGQITVAVAAEGYSPITVETELVTGELTDVAVTLSPLQYANVNINVLDGAGSSVYLGALYMGEAPLTLRLPLNQLEYITVENRKEMAKAVFSSPDLPSDTFDLSLKTKIPPPSGEQRVNKARKWYYWAWGGTWLTGITAWITYGIYSGQNAALEKSNSQEFYNRTRAVYFISTGAIVAVGVAIGYEVFQMGRYLYTANEDATPIIRREIQKK